MGLGTQLLGSGILNFSRCTARQHHELSPVTEASIHQRITKQAMNLNKDKRNLLNVGLAANFYDAEF